MRRGLGVALAFAAPAALGQQPQPALQRLDAEQRSISLSGLAPQGLDVDLESGLVYVSNNGSLTANCQSNGQGVRNSMSVVDAGALRELTRVDGIGGPVWPLVDPRRGVVYSANSGAKSLTVHARGTAALLATLPLGGRPHQMGLDPESPFLVVSNTRDETQTWISVVDAAAFALSGNLPVTPLPHGVAVDPDRHVAYVSSVSDGTNAIVDLTSGTATGSLRTTDSTSPNANMNAFSRRLRRLFVSDGARGGAVAVDVDSGASAGVVRFGAPAWGMQVDEATGLLYAALPGLDAIGVADAASATPLALIPVDGCPFAVRLDTVRRLGFSTSMSQGRLTRFDLGRVEAALGRSPSR